MALCFENIQLPTCAWSENGDKRNTLASILAGILVSNKLLLGCLFLLIKYKYLIYLLQPLFFY
jgi:hypothetical protein